MHTWGKKTRANSSSWKNEEKWRAFKLVHTVHSSFVCGVLIIFWRVIKQKIYPKCWKEECLIQLQLKTFNGEEKEWFFLLICRRSINILIGFYKDENICSLNLFFADRQSQQKFPFLLISSRLFCLIKFISLFWFSCCIGSF